MENSWVINGNYCVPRGFSTNLVFNYFTTILS